MPRWAGSGIGKLCQRRQALDLGPPKLQRSEHFSLCCQIVGCKAAVLALKWRCRVQEWLRDCSETESLPLNPSLHQLGLSNLFTVFCHSSMQNVPASFHPLFANLYV